MNLLTKLFPGFEWQLGMDPRALAIKIAWQMYGLPYRWGGDDPMGGFDCSGMIVEILKSTGKLKVSDATASGLFELFELNRKEHPAAGYLVFYQNSPGGRIAHVELCLDNRFSIGASGGGSGTTNESAAERQNAFIKVRPIERGRPIAGYVDPFEEEPAPLNGE